MISNSKNFIMNTGRVCYQCNMATLSSQNIYFLKQEPTLGFQCSASVYWFHIPGVPARWRWLSVPVALLLPSQMITLPGSLTNRAAIALQEKH